MKRLVMFMIMGILLTGSVAYDNSPTEIQAETVKESESKPWINAYESKLRKLNNSDFYDEKYKKFNQIFNYLDDGKAAKRVVNKIFNF